VATRTRRLNISADEEASGLSVKWTGSMLDLVLLVAMIICVALYLGTSKGQGDAVNARRRPPGEPRNARDA
jgi:hypothetical protein